MNDAIASSFSRAGIGRRSISSIAASRRSQRSGEERVEHLVLGLEVVVDEAVGDARLVGDVGDAARVEPLAREHPHRRVEDQAALVDRGGLHARAPSGRR